MFYTKILLTGLICILALIGCSKKSDIVDSNEIVVSSESEDRMTFFNESIVNNLNKTYIFSKSDIFQALVQEDLKSFFADKDSYVKTMGHSDCVNNIVAKQDANLDDSQKIDSAISEVLDDVLFYSNTGETKHGMRMDELYATIIYEQLYAFGLDSLDDLSAGAFSELGKLVKTIFLYSGNITEIPYKVLNDEGIVGGWVLINAEIFYVDSNNRLAIGRSEPHHTTLCSDIPNNVLSELQNKIGDEVQVIGIYGVDNILEKSIVIID